MALFPEAYAFIGMNYHSCSLQDLVQECFRAGSDEAWQSFLERFNRLIECIVFRTARRWDSIAATECLEDLKQDVYVKLYTERANLLDCFKAQHPDAFYGFLKALTANLVHDHFKALRARKRGSGMVMNGLDDNTRLASRDEEHERRILLREIDLALAEASFSNQERILFWLHYREGFTASAVAGLPTTKLSTKGVESLFHRMIGSVRARVAVRPLPPTPSAVGRKAELPVVFIR